jgi:hypothetical protein
MLKKLENVLTGVALVVFLLVAGVYLNGQYDAYATKRTQQEQARQREASAMKVGDVVQIPSVDLASQRHNIFVMVQKGCAHCENNADFYKKIQDRAIALMPQVDTVWLEDLGLHFKGVYRANAGRLHIAGTPTLFVTDGAGRVEYVHQGEVSEEQEQAVLARLTSLGG